MQKSLNPIEQEKILDSTYVSARDIYKLYPLSLQSCNRIISDICKQTLAEGYNLLPSRPRVVLLERVLKKYPLDTGGIRRAASRMRKEARLDGEVKNGISR